MENGWPVSLISALNDLRAACQGCTESIPTVALPSQMEWEGKIHCFRFGVVSKWCTLCTCNHGMVTKLIISRNRLNGCAWSSDTIYKSILKSWLFVHVVFLYLYILTQLTYFELCHSSCTFYLFIFLFILSINVTAFVLIRVNTVIFSNKFKQKCTNRSFLKLNYNCLVFYVVNNLRLHEITGPNTTHT